MARLGNWHERSKRCPAKSIVHELGLDFGCGQIGKDFAHQSQCGGDQKALLCLRPIAWWRAGASSFELLRYLFTNAPRQIVVVDYASRLVVEYHVTGIFPAATGPAVMGDVLNFQPSHNLEKNEQAKKNQKNLAAAPRDKAPRSAPHLFRSLIVVASGRFTSERILPNPASLPVCVSPF